MTVVNIVGVGMITIEILHDVIGSLKIVQG